MMGAADYRPGRLAGLAHAGVVVLLCTLFGYGGVAAGETPPGGGAGKPVSAAPVPAAPVPAAPQPSQSGVAPDLHRIPAHATAPCRACHAGVEASVLAGDDLRPRAAACAACHADGVTLPSRLPPPPPKLHFSHRAHLLRGTPCASCHGDSAQAIGLPAMDTCLGCHRAQRASSCILCHRAAPDGRLLTDFPDGDLRPRGPLLGMAHDRDWLIRHRWVGADRGEVCASCHTQRDCVRCHDGRRLPAAIHPGDYLSLHAQDARRGAQRCQSCHTPQHFCAECHARLGLIPSAPRDLRATRRFHPAAAQWSRGAVLHAAEARRALTDCVSCHSESDCVACHATTPQGGAGHSPHGAGFGARCAAALSANPRACATCHGDLESLRARCR